MSRLKRLKERKRKNRIKATVCGLALFLQIGSIRLLGTHALFADVEDIPTNISISTGDVEVEVEDRFNKINLEQGKEYNNEFSISNKGTISQKVYLTFDYEGANYLDGIIYKLQVIYKDRVLDEIIKSGEDFKKSEEIEIKDNDSEFILEAGENITCKTSILLEETDNVYLQDNCYFDLKITSKQIGFDDYGFYDVDYQKNEISIVDKNQCEVILGNCKCCNLPAIIFDYPEEFKNKNVDIYLPDENKIDGFSAHYNYKTKKIYLVKRWQDKYPLKEEDILRKEGFKVNFVTNKGKYSKYTLKFKKMNGQIIGKWIKKEVGNLIEIEEEIMSEVDEVEEQNEEIKELNEIKFIELVKEEDIASDEIENTHENHEIIIEE